MVASLSASLDRAVRRQLVFLGILIDAGHLGIKKVVFTGHVSPQTLAACYHYNDIFASTSDHEGFCVPILECFHHGKPIISYAAGAVPETLGDAGILMDRRREFTFAPLRLGGE